jgi:drug/metabolite transporter (DMT)-like permease
MPLRHDLRRGIVFMLAACALFTFMNVLIKLLGDRIPFNEQMFFRSLLALPVVALVALRRSRGAGPAALVNTLRTKRFGGHFLRACTGTLAMGTSFYSLTILPVAEHTALTNTTPLWATLLAIPLLGEKVGIHRSSAVVVGFIGILIVAMGQGAFQGGFEGAMRWGLIAAVMQGVFSAITTLLVRNLSATESSVTIVMWQSLLMTAIVACSLPFAWATPSLHDLLVMIAIGLLGGCAQIMLTEAWASAQVSALAPYSYSSLLFAVLFGWVAFGDVPALATFAGAALIVAASLYILHREMVRKGTKT